MQEQQFLNQSRGSASTAPASYWRKLIPRRPIEIVLLVLVAAVISLHLKYLWDVRTTVPHQDDWSLLDGMLQSLDAHRVGMWVFDSPNGHFIVPGALACLVSLRYLSLDLTALRLLNFPICLAAFCLIAHVVNLEIRSRFLRFYLYTGACFIVFNLCFWEHFAQANGFSAMLSVLFGGLGLYYTAKALQISSKWRNYLVIGLGFLIGSVLSSGAGYAAAAAAISVCAFSRLKKLAVSRPLPKHEIVTYGLAYAFGLLAISTHPFFHLKSRLIQTLFRAVLVAGSFGSSFLDQNGLVAQNVAFVCGVILIVASLSIGLDFSVGQRRRIGLLPVFSLALVMFGLLGCVAVAVARWQLPNGEFLSSRYTLYPSVCLLGILLYFARSKLFLLTHIWCFVAAGYLLATVKEEQVAFYRPAVYRKIELTIRNSDNLSDEQLRAALYWGENTSGVRRVAARMRRDRLNAFHH
jgi:hypothetical protein